MKKAYVFPGQGSQFEGMGRDLYDQHDMARRLFDQANELLGWRITDVMFEGSKEALTQTNVTQPALFLESYIRAAVAGDAFQPAAVAGHSLGEFTALAAVGVLGFEDALLLVKTRAFAMQQACEMRPGGMSAVLGLDDEIVEQVCAGIDAEMVVAPANYNSPGQLVISGSKEGLELAASKLQMAGARRVAPLAVGGAFHSPLMEPAREQLEAAIRNTRFSAPRCPIYQNVNAQPETDPERISLNLIAQLTAPVRWTQTIRQMLADGIECFVEVGGGPAAVLRGLIRRIEKEALAESI
ncbi:MAG: ACP S-malonyltransferase [Saprospiraceae bacterium]